MLSFGSSPRVGASQRLESGRAPVRRRAWSCAAAAAGLIAFGLGAFLHPDSASAAARLYMQSGGVNRSALVIQHEALKLRRRPLVVVLRPRREPGLRRHHLAFQEVVESAKPVFLYPEPLGGVWPVAAGPESNRDIAFLRDLINRFVNEGVGDPRKIFLVGESSGGVLAYRAACAGLGRPIAGIATMGAALPADLARCGFDPMAFIAVNSIANPNVPFAGGKARIGGAAFDALSAETTLGLFASRAGCGGRREQRPLIERDSHGTPRVRGAILTFSGCRIPVEELRLGTLAPRNGAQKPGHIVAPVNEGRDFNAARRVWDFLRRNGA
jgi:polyhydroxybutyrate depolymerase